MTAQVLFTLGALIALALAMSDPMTERPKELFVSLFFCLSMPLLEAMGNFVRKGTVGAMSAIVYAVYVAFMGAVAYGVSSKRALIQRKGPAFLEKFVIKQVRSLESVRPKKDFSLLSSFLTPSLPTQYSLAPGAALPGI